MALPAGINNKWLATIGIPDRVIKKARVLSLEDRFAESNQVLDRYLAQALFAHHEENSSAVEALTLYGWNILLLRNETALQVFFEQLESVDLSCYPEILAIKYWGMLRRGRYIEVHEKSSRFVEENLSPISADVGHFMWGVSSGGAWGQGGGWGLFLG